MPVETEAPIPHRDLPFVVAVLADLSGDGRLGGQQRLAERALLDFTCDSFRGLMRQLGPQLRLVGAEIPDDGAAELRFEELEDFAPDRVADYFPSLRRKLRLRRGLSHLLLLLEEAPDLMDAITGALRHEARRFDLLRAAEGADDAEGAGLLRDLVATARSRRLSVLRDDPLPALRHLLVWARPDAADPPAELRRMISELDAQLTDALTPVLGHPRFRALEATWRGLWFLVSRSMPGLGRRVFVLDASRDEIGADLRAGSALSGRFCEAPFELGEDGSRPLAEPASILLVDWSWEANTGDLHSLGALARLAADCHAVALTNAAPSLVGLEDWASLRANTEVKIEPAGEVGEAWRGLRAMPESRHLALVMPPVAAREPYGRGGPPAAGFTYEEEDDATPQMSPAWVLAARLCREDEQSGWFVGLRSFQPDGWSPGLSRARRDGGNAYSRMTDRTELAAFHAGLIPLSVSATGEPFFTSVAMVHQPRRYDRPETTRDAAIAARLPFVLGTGRLMQALRVTACELI